MRILDYSGAMYALLADSIASGYRTYTIAGYLDARETGTLDGRYVIMRHDVDANPGNALLMAKTEAHRGIRSTYYFRMKRGIFVPSIIRKIARMGHEIGYHYEVLSDTRGDIRRARRLFADNLACLRRIAPVRTACMHGRSLSRHHNLHFWDYCDLSTFDLIGEPYLSIDYHGIFYFSDTGLKWHNQGFNLRDAVSSKGDMGVRTTPELIGLFDGQVIDRAAVLTHTNNWVDHPVTWTSYKALFFFLNHYKRLLKLFRER